MCMFVQPQKKRHSRGWDGMCIVRWMVGLVSSLSLYHPQLRVSEPQVILGVGFVDWCWLALVICLDGRLGLIL